MIVERPICLGLTTLCNPQAGSLTTPPPARLLTFTTCDPETQVSFTMGRSDLKFQTNLPKVSLHQTIALPYRTCKVYINLTSQDNNPCISKVTRHDKGHIRQL